MVSCTEDQAGAAQSLFRSQLFAPGTNPHLMDRQHARPNACEQPGQDGRYSQRGPCNTEYSHSAILLSLTQTPEGLHHTSHGLTQWAPETLVHCTSHLMGTLNTAAGQQHQAHKNMSAHRLTRVALQSVTHLRRLSHVPTCL